MVHRVHRALADGERVHHLRADGVFLHAAPVLVALPEPVVANLAAHARGLERVAEHVMVIVQSLQHFARAQAGAQAALVG